MSEYGPGSKGARDSSGARAQEQQRAQQQQVQQEGNIDALLIGAIVVIIVVLGPICLAYFVH